jgi:hypothetical protein
MISKDQISGEYCSEKIRNIKLKLNKKAEFILTEREGKRKGTYKIQKTGKIHLVSKGALNGREIYPYLIEKKGKKIVSLVLGKVNLSQLYCKLKTKS